jgi:Icc-related predicted phosphoesterase
MTSEIFPDGACWWTGGNDDEESVLAEVSETSPDAFRYVEDAVVDIAGFKLASMGYSNETPFHTSRELTEVDLKARLRLITAGVSDSDQVILNVHVPPFGCGSLDVVATREAGVMEHVGSHAVREFIEETQPVAALVGHIHEGKGVARLGRTEVFNPGSDYTAGVLNAFVLSFNPLRGRSEFVHIRV